MIELENNDPKHEGLEKEVAFELIIKKNELLDSLFVTLKFSVYSTYVMLAINSVFIELTAETLNPFSRRCLFHILLCNVNCSVSRKKI